MKILNDTKTTRDGITTRTATLADGTAITYCHPHHSWEWDCMCGHVNKRADVACDDCGRDRVTEQAA